MTGLKPTSAGPLALIVAGFCVAATFVQAGSELRVVADIAPVQSLVAQVMDGVGQPELLLRSSTSPHDYSMKPSEARLLDRADVVVWTGPVLTPWLQDAIATLAPDATQVTFSSLDGVHLLPFRRGARFESHDEHEAQDHGSGQGDDPHVWLDPRNAAILVSELARVLSKRDPDNATRYRSNAQATLDALEAIEVEINARVGPLRSRPYLVFHDAYHYFESRFDIPAAGAVSVGDAVKPGAKRIRELQKTIADQGVVCLFAEPQFSPLLMQRLTEGAEVRSGGLDPIGNGIAPGKGHYQRLLRAMADGMSDCLQP